MAAERGEALELAALLMEKLTPTNVPRTCRVRAATEGIDQLLWMVNPEKDTAVSATAPPG